LHVVPPYSFALPSIIINELFDVDNYRLLAFAILLPTVFRINQLKKIKKQNGGHTAELFIYAYLVLQLILLLPYENITNTMRRGTLFMLDVVLLFYVVRRSSTDQKKLAEAIAAFALACAIFVPIAFFEQVRFWLLYEGLAAAWSVDASISSFLLRGNSLRAMASTGHSLALGYLLSMALVLWLYLSINKESRLRVTLGIIGIWVGLIAAFSRAPWVTAILGVAAYLVLQPKGMAKLSKTLVLLLPISAVALAFPFGQRILEVMPFMGGQVDAGSIDYRKQLGEAALERIQANPLFGDPFFMSHLEHLRQGQGIIDLVNVYASIAMLYGVVGLVLFIAPFLLAMHGTYTNARKLQIVNPDLALMGNALFACMVATAFFMYTGSFGTGLAKFFYILAALGLAYSTLARGLVLNK
jgi:O-antigen ligase